MEPLAIAVAQMASARGDVHLNVEKHVEFAIAAASRGACLTVFPELSLTGYELDVAEKLAFSVSDSRLSPLQEVADSTNSTLVAGAPARLGPDLNIGAFIIEPHRPVKVYAKQNITANEAKAFVPGSENPLVDVGGELGAAAICADTTYPSHAAQAVKRGVGFYLAGVFFGPERIEENREQLASYASQHGLVVAMANSAGPSSQFESAGRSSIWCPNGECVAHVDTTDPALVIARRSRDGWTGESIGI